jgi:peptidoglycan/LPS O-acetylase OafA/YrhL
VSRRSKAAGALGLLLVVSVVFGPSGHSWWEFIPGFYALLGFGGACLLAFVAKSVGGRWLERPRSYYDV